MKNLYYRSLLKRDNLILAYFLSLFRYLLSYPRLLLEVFIRKEFGERYFRLSSALTVALIVGLLPLVFGKLIPKWSGQDEFSGDEFGFNEAESAYQAPVDYPLWPDYLLWYVFLAAFIVFSVKHAYDQWHSPSVFHFSRFSLSAGKLHPLFFKINFWRIKANPRLIECLFEPLLFLLIGIVLALIGQALGWLLIVCSIFYSMNYIVDYRAGDNFVMDKIDEMILNEELENSFLHDIDEEDTRGFRFRGQKPDAEEYRKRILPLFFEDEPLEAQ